MNLNKSLIFILLIVLLFLPSCKSKSSLEALKRGRLEELKEFHKKGENLNVLINKNDTFLTYSIKNRFEKISLWIIENKINDINATDDSENTPIMLAVLYDSKKTLKLLLKNKAKLDDFNIDGKNLISIIAERGNFNYFIQLIKKYKIDIKFKVPYGIYEGYSIVEFVVAGGNLKMLKYLKKRKFRFNVENNLNLNLMMIAAERGHLEIMTYLETLGFKMDSKNKDGWTTLMSAAKSGKLDAVMLILGYGANINAYTRFKWTALMSAVISKNIEVVKFLVESKADIMFENNDKKNAVEISIDEENYKIADYLRKMVSDE